MDCFHKISLSGTPSENWRIEILEMGWLGVIDLMRNESVPLEVMPAVFKCSVQEMSWPLTSRTEILNTSGISSHGTDSFRAKLLNPSHLFPRSQPA